MLKVVFLGTPEFAKDFLASLHEDEEILVSAVVCQSDKPVGRKQVMTPPATKLFALENDIPVYQPSNLKKDEGLVQTLKSLNADMFVIVAYGKIIPKSILEIPKLGNINVHPSLLPKYRGPSPIQSAIAAGDKESGVSIMLIDEEMDHGPILAQTTIDFDKNETPESFRVKVIDVAAPLLVETIKRFAVGEIKPKEQNHDSATICKLLSREDGIIDWSESAQIIESKIRGYTPWPGTTTKWNDKTLKIIRAAVPPLPEGGLGGEGEIDLEPGHVKIIDNRLLIGTGSGALEIIEIQPEGKPKMAIDAFLNGHPEIDGAKLS